ncbi:MAG: class I SAM-dependent methyltransferase [Candidatus Eisenbacteria bacterium]
MTENTDTGALLRSLYAPAGGVAKIFSSKVEDYVASRPDYPTSLYDALGRVANLDAESLIADIGAGTGLLTQGFLQRGYAVVAVEPNAEMRQAADHMLQAFPRYHSLSGSAESIPLEATSVDLITAAHAFHWFKVEEARAECLRVLRPGGQVALIWNDRLLSDPLHVALDDILAQFGGEKRAALAAHEERGEIPTLFGATTSEQMTWQHEHALSQAGLLSLVFSRSYMPERTSSAGQEVSERVQQVFQSHARTGSVLVRYTTVLIVGRPR